jgi:alpha-galactosidase
MKITLIGAGSVVFAKTLISDILQFPELSDATICLMDIDPARVKVAEAMTRKIIAKLGVKAKVEATLNQRQAVKSANYVICTIQVGGYKPGTTTDFDIPRKYGVQQTIADTLGVGGVFRALRTIPVINKIAQDIAEVGAPNCLLLNYTNPMAMNCWAVDRAVGIPHVGLCHSVQGTSGQLARFVGLPHEEVSYLVAGINHMAFFLKFEHKKRDIYPKLFALLDNPDFTKEKVRFEMMRRTGYFVTESSEHQSEYVPYFIHHGKDIIKKFDIPIDEYIRRCKENIVSWKKSEADLLGKGGDITVRPQGHEYGSYIIHSRETNRPRVIYGNVPNRQLITNLPTGCCVEVPCLVDGQGIQPTHIGDLPPQLAAICQTNINVQALTVEAALTKRRDHIYHAVMLDPHTSTVLTLDKIWAMCDELIAAHQKHGLLGEFKNGRGVPTQRANRKGDRKSKSRVGV